MKKSYSDMFLRMQKSSVRFLAIFLLSIYYSGVFAQTADIPGNSVVIREGMSPDEIIDLAARIRPSERQLEWQKMELTTFIHFTMNTFYNQEWGKGTEDPAKFNPSQLDAAQWTRVCREAGSRCLILTCKHHDGFCLWPSRYTGHNISASPYKQGKGDIVREVSDACAKEGIGFGIYLSPWDRHEKSYGTSDYNQFFLNQLTELLTNYGPVKEVWFDGACGEGPNGKKQVYDWESYYKLIRRLQPDAVIAVMGPDVRWVGTESGYGRETEWSVVPVSLADQDLIAGNSQQTATDNGFIPTGDMMAQDLGCREIITKARKLIWYPSEVDVSIRPGWFWHESENARVKPPEKLLDIYFSSVGRNSVLLLNIPPDTRGLIHENDIASLKEWRRALNEIFANNLAAGSKATSSESPNLTDDLTDDTLETAWQPSGKLPAMLELEFSSPRTFSVLMLQENITEGQRVESFYLEALTDGIWKRIASGNTIGYKRLLRFPETTASGVRLVIDQCRLTPSIASLGLYRMIPSVTANPARSVFREQQKVELKADSPDCTIYYTTDGTEPHAGSLTYHEPILLDKSAHLRFIAIRNDGTRSFENSGDYTKSEYSISFVNLPDEKYSGGSPSALIDGIKGSTAFDDGKWTGFNGNDMEIVIDLGSKQKVRKISAGFLENTRSWIFFPVKTEYFVSKNGTDYIKVSAVELPKATSDHEQRKEVTVNMNARVRYVKVKACNTAVIPVWHEARGEKAWLFSDEITVETVR